MTDLFQILHGCANNDARCQKLFYDRYLGYAFKIAYRYVRSYDKAADATNDSFIKIFTHFEKFEIRDKENAEIMLLGWMRRIIINTSINHLKHEAFITEFKPEGDSVWDKADETQTGEGQMLYKELIGLIRRLSPAYRAVFNLHVIDGYTHQEIAEILGISVGTSKSNLAKAKAALQKNFITDNKGNVLCFT